MSETLRRFSASAVCLGHCGVLCDTLGMLTLALEHLSLGMAYGIWGGVGTLLTTLIGIVVWHDVFSAVVGLGMIAVAAGVALLSLGAQEAEERA